MDFGKKERELVGLTKKNIINDILLKLNYY